MVKEDYQFIYTRSIAQPVDLNDKPAAVNHYCAYMLARTQSMFEYKGLPESIPERNLELLLQTHGYVCVTKVNDKLYALYGTLGGLPDAYYMPTECIVANPYLKFNKTLKIDEDCIIIRNDSLYMGLLPMFKRYATLLAENDISIRIADINARITNVISADDDRTLKSAKDYLKDVEDGKLGIVGESSFLEGIKSNAYSGNNTNTITQLIELQQYLKASWFNDLGINANYNMKRESLNSAESQLNNDALLPFIDDMLKQRKLAIENINKKYGTSITVDFNSAWKLKVEEMNGNKEQTGENKEEKQENSQKGEEAGQGCDWKPELHGGKPCPTHEEK